MSQNAKIAFNFLLDFKMMRPCEKFRQNLLVKFYFMKDFDFLIHELK